VAREVGTEGKLGGQAEVRGVAGTWKDLTDNVNTLAGNLTSQVREIARVTTAVANGDLAQKITVDVRGEIFQRHPGAIAAIIVEPVAANMGVVPPANGFLEGLRDLAKQHGALLIFDEVVTGFRVGWGGAQGLYGIRPDLTCLGKVIGGGLPVGAYGGRRDIMELIAPLGSVYQAGTLSGNPLAMAAGIETLRLLQDEGAYARLERLSARLSEGLTREATVPVQANRVASAMTLFFTDNPVSDYASAKGADTARYAKFFRGMLGRGVYLAPSQFEAGFVSLAHTEEDVDRTVEAARETFRAL